MFQRLACTLVALHLLLSPGAVSCDDASSREGPQSAAAAAAAAAKSSELKTQKACARGDLVCEKDRLAYDAIKDLHEQLDDDKNGNVDLDESEEFLREELQYKTADSLRKNNFHNNDTLVSVADLWDMWIRSEVHNWTVEEVAKWVEYHVELPQYAAVFKAHAVDGASLPRIASNSLGFVSIVLGVKNPVHRQKLGLKAMDVVLFGAPKSQSLVKDVLLATAIAVAVGGILFARHEYKVSQQNLRRWETDICSLQSLQEKLEGEQNEKKLLSEGKQVLEARIHSEMNEAKAEAERLRISRVQTETELTRLKLAEEELQKVREALADAERQLELHRSSDSMPLGAQQLPMTVSAELQQWLQITYELEQRAYQLKKSAAEHELSLAKDACEKLRKKKNAFLGSLRMAHTSTLDEFEYQIVHAKHALEEVKMDFAERQQRWQAIEALTGIQVETNPGLATLASLTGHKYLQDKLSNGNLSAPLMSLDDVDELSDVHPGYAPLVARYASRYSLTRTSRSQNRQSAADLQQLQQRLESDRLRNVSSAAAFRKFSSEQDDCSSLAGGRSSIRINGDDQPQFTLYDEPCQDVELLSNWSNSCEALAGCSLRPAGRDDAAMVSMPSLYTSTTTAGATTTAATGSSAMLSSACDGIDGKAAVSDDESCMQLDVHVTTAAPPKCDGLAAVAVVPRSNEPLVVSARTSDGDHGPDVKQKEKKKRSLLFSFKGGDGALKNLAHKMAKERAKAATS